MEILALNLLHDHFIHLMQAMWKPGNRLLSVIKIAFSAHNFHVQASKEESAKMIQPGIRDNTGYFLAALPTTGFLRDFVDKCITLRCIH